MVIVLVLSFVPANTNAQSKHHIDLNHIVYNITNTTNHFPPEKLYVQTDKPSYHVDDTLWFKTYLFNAAYLNASHKSGILYIEIDNKNNQMVKRRIVSLHDGLGWGNIALLKDKFPSGTYTLRAYTNWMRNFDKHCIFQKQFYINDFSDQDWLIHSRFNILPESDGKTINAQLSFSKISGRPVLFRNVQVALTDGTKIWHKNKFRTDVKGDLNFDFKISKKTNRQKLALLIQDIKEGGASSKYIVPVILNNSVNIDLQFMPEGGSLIAGVKNRVAFKAINEDGMSLDVSGDIYNDEQKKMTHFKSTHRGMGSFYLTPELNETYSAVIKLKNGNTKRYPLPSVKSSGIVLDVVNSFKSDSIEVNIIPSPYLQSTDPCYLIAQARGVGCFGALVTLNKGRKSFHISKDIFPTGIARFTLLNADKKPIHQRIFFIEHHDQLRPHLVYKKQYAPRNKVVMNIKVLDKTESPVQGSFSIAVTNDNQVKIDTIKRNSLVSYLFLTSNLKGYVEDPGYYFQSGRTRKMWQDLDNLLLTQGWVNYVWDSVSKSPKNIFQAEKSFSIKGSVTNIFNNPIVKSKVILLSNKPLVIKTTTTNKEGEFTFSNLHPVDSASYMIQARNKHGKSFNVGIQLDEFKPPVFKPLNHRLIPWYVNIDTTSPEDIHTQIANKEEINKLLGKHALKEVIIVGQKIIKGSKNLNGPGGSDLALEESDMHKEGKKTLGDILRQKVKGLRLGGKHLELYVVNNKPVRLIIDGVYLNFFKPAGITYNIYYDQYLDYLTAEDIKGIEVMTSPKYVMTYSQKFLKPNDNPFEQVFIEITTYSGNGAFLKKTPGVYLYRPPMTFGTPEQFYSPRYKIKAPHNFKDFRSTIYWNPDIITNKKGEARISFYTADNPGTYTLIMEGSDMNGHIESIVRKITVKSD